MIDDVTPSQALIDFWLQAGPERWGRKSEAFDADFRGRFLALCKQAAVGYLDGWATTSE